MTDEAKYTDDNYGYVVCSDEHRLNIPGCFLKFNLTFAGSDNQEIGSLYEEDGKLHFKGDVEESAETFFNSLVNFYSTEVGKLNEDNKILKAGIKTVRELIDESDGVQGLHRDGTVAEWDELQSRGIYEHWLLKFNEAEKLI